MIRQLFTSYYDKINADLALVLFRYVSEKEMREDEARHVGEIANRPRNAARLVLVCLAKGPWTKVYF